MDRHHNASSHSDRVDYWTDWRSFLDPLVLWNRSRRNLGRCGKSCYKLMGFWLVVCVASAAPLFPKDFSSDLYWFLFPPDLYGG